ncbi:MAG: type II toxin-antitoxin system HicA family toxin [Chloroflexi bacterium]|nr:type II toxin-antitoxin system HicA family toxin [Chloroflexota bacterium]
MSPKLPQVTGRQAVRALEKAGWYVERTRGSHAIMRHPTRPGAKIVVPIHSRPMKPHILGNIIKGAGLGIVEFRELI